MTIAAMQAACRLLDSLNIGYDQGNRWSFFPHGKPAAKGVKVEADCSTICGAIAKMGGAPIVLSGTFYTGNAATKFKAAGFKALRFNSMSQVKVGDFLLTPSHHLI